MFLRNYVTLIRGKKKPEGWLTMFIHTRIRLFCELHRAQRWLTHEDFMSKWLKDEMNQLEIVGIEPREKVECVWSSADAQGNTFKDAAVFHMMPCAARTQYCTEIHLMVHPDTARFGLSKGAVVELDHEAVEGWRKSALGYWKQALESLRQCVNGDWVIEDRDLNRSVLLKSRL